MWTIRSTASARRPAAAERPDRGAGLVGTFVGFAIFLVLLLFAVQVVIRLYATSAITSAATRAAQSVAQAPVPELEVAGAEAAARQELGTFASSRARFIWEEVDASQVVLRVVARSPEFLPGFASWSSIARTVTVRTERFR